MTLIPSGIANFFTAMQAGQVAGDALVALFSEQATYTEPFSGTPVSHVGRDAIRTAFARGWEFPLPEMFVRIDHAEVTDGQIFIRWTCHSPALPGGFGCGTNRYVMDPDGLIAELETTITMASQA